MTISTRTIVRPQLLPDVVTGDLLTDRAVIIEGSRITAIAADADAPADGSVVVDLPGRRCCWD